MGDNAHIPQLSGGRVVLADEVTLGGVIGIAQYMKLLGGDADSAERIPGTAAKGLRVEPRASAAAAAVTSVAGATSETSILAANANRQGAFVFNDSTADLYLKYGAGATTTSFSVKIPAGGYWEMPLPVFTGVLTGVWSAAAGSARVTDLT